AVDLAFGQHEDRTLTHGYAATREAAMATFTKSWRREEQWKQPASCLLECEDCTLVACYRSLYAPRAGGADDSHHRTAGVAGRTRRRGSRDTWHQVTHPSPSAR